jgi:hypothetical protein
MTRVRRTITAAAAVIGVGLAVAGGAAAAHAVGTEPPEKPGTNMSDGVSTGRPPSK